MSFLEEPLLWNKRQPSASQPGRQQGRSKKRQVLSSSDNVRSTPPVLPHTVEPCSAEAQREKNQEMPERELTVQPQGETDEPTREGKKRGAEAEEETSDDATVAKRVCIEEMQQPTSETNAPRSESADFEQAAIEDIINVETLSLTSVADGLQREEQEEKTVWTDINLRETDECLTDEEKESGGDEMIDVDGDEEDGRSQSGPVPLSVFTPVRSEVGLESQGSWDRDEDEDIDVIGGSGPVPDPVIISWTESSEDEKEEGEEDIDVAVGEKAINISSAVLTIS